MLKKYSVPMALGDRAHFDIKGAGRSPGWLELTRLDVTDGVLAWEMRSSQGHTIVGNAYSEIRNPLLAADCWVKPKMPIVMHVRNGACAMDVIFCIPGAAFIEVVRGQPKTK